VVFDLPIHGAAITAQFIHILVRNLRKKISRKEIQDCQYLRERDTGLGISGPDLALPDYESRPFAGEWAGAFILSPEDGLDSKGLHMAHSPPLP